MSKKSEKPTRKAERKDLDPKAAAAKVKGGAHPILHDGRTYRGLEPIRELTPDVSPPR